ncbi:uncharacterized protein LOC107864520 [Capsicum annuum]|uniref:uncharacterized protein LOC107864520 n=1 Tax=Capsicum annuum TaxID=4072 RepID=UPI001FB0929C|nr:uncharacterized protein LOC107864520 [Capsicum annuum]
MEKQGEIEIGKTNYFEVSFSALRKDVVNVLDFMERLKNEKDQNVVNVYLIERLMRLELAFICTYVQLSYSDLDQFEDKSDCFKSRVELPPPESPSYIQVFSSQYEILQNVSGNMKDFHGLIVIGCIEHDIVQYVSPQFQLIAERVALFLWDVRIDGDSRLFKLPHLLMKIIPVELEVMHICFTNLKASPSAEVGRFSKQLLETSPEVLREYLIHLQEHVVTVITASTSGPRNIHVMIEFLLIILTDLPKEIIHHDKLFDLLARAAALIREVSTLIHDLEEKSRNEESTNETSRTTLDLLKNIELLKEDLKYVYLKAPDSYQCCFPMHLLLIHLNDLLDSDSYSIALIKEEIRLVKEDLEFVRFIKEDVSQLPEKNPKNKSLIVVNSPKNPVERKSLTTGKILGKTTLAYKVYNDERVCSHFDLRAWLTVGQEYDEKKLLMKLFNQVTGDLKVRKDIDVADILRKHLIRKRYLIVLDDVWDTTTWDELTRPFPKVEKGSRIILTTRQKEVALHGKCYTDPLNLRLLKPEESWELLEKRAFGKESCPDELLNVGKEIAQNCKGLPLVADLIAGVIAGREKTKSEVDVRKVIGLSYDHLPHHLKPYFLCLARYPKDSVMDRDVLKAIWRAEGLGEQTGIKSVEEVMKVYLDNLISSSLVIAFNDIGMLNHLRYLYIGTEVKSLPSSISFLWNLEVLRAKNLESTLVLLPSIWDLLKLRMLSMVACSFYDLDTDELDSRGLKSLRT